MTCPFIGCHHCLEEVLAPELERRGLELLAITCGGTQPHRVRLHFHFAPACRDRVSVETTSSRTEEIASAVLVEVDRWRERITLAALSSP